MPDLIRRFRGLGVALVVLALSAGVVFAGAPRIALVADDETTVEQPTTESPTTESPTTETPTTGTPDADGGSDDAEDPASADADDAGVQGELVSGAAQASTPPGFRNHGAFVACVARWHTNPEAPAIADSTLLTPADCGLEPTTAPDGDADPEAGADADDDAAGAAGKAKGAARAEAGKARAEAAKGNAKGRGGR